MPGDINYYWLNPSWYNFMSSEYGGILVKVVGFILIVLVLRWVIKPWIARIHHHMECEVPRCNNWGHPVHGTSHKACHIHHPHLDPAGHTAGDIKITAEQGHYGEHL